MYKFACIFMMSATLFLSGCLSNVWTGANLVYDRHATYHKLTDFQMGANANRALYKDREFKQDGIFLELAVFNRDILLTGIVPTEALRNEACDRVKAATPGRRRLFNQVAVGTPGPDFSVQDAWITAKIRSRIVADADIDPEAFKIVTSDRIVYLMGDVIPEQANKVILFARESEGVRRVVKLFKYYNLSDQPK